MSFSDSLKAIRKEKNLSQEELAELLGVSRQLFQNGNWEMDILKLKSCLLFQKN